MGSHSRAPQRESSFDDVERWTFFGKNNVERGRRSTPSAVPGSATPRACSPTPATRLLASRPTPARGISASTSTPWLRWRSSTRWPEGLFLRRPLRAGRRRRPVLRRRDRLHRALAGPVTSLPSSSLLSEVLKGGSPERGGGRVATASRGVRRAPRGSRCSIGRPVPRRWLSSGRSGA